MKNIDEFVGNAILENPIEISLGGKKFKIAPPTTATLIEVSRFIATLPEINFSDEKIEKLSNGEIDNDDIYLALSIAKDCTYLGDLLAILILGKKYITQEIKVEKTEKKLWIFKSKKEVTEIKNNQKELSEIILNELSIKDISDLISIILSQMSVGFFLTSIGFLQKIRLLKPTTTTAFGQ